MLDKDVLGQALYDARNAFNDLTYDQVIAQYGTIDAYRLAVCKADAKAIIDHITANARLTVPGTGLLAGSAAVTGTSTTGTIQ